MEIIVLLVIDGVKVVLLNNERKLNGVAVNRNSVVEGVEGVVGGASVVVVVVVVEVVYDRAAYDAIDLAVERKVRANDVVDETVDVGNDEDDKSGWAASYVAYPPRSIPKILPAFNKVCWRMLSEIVEFDFYLRRKSIKKKIYYLQIIHHLDLVDVFDDT